MARRNEGFSTDYKNEDKDSYAWKAKVGALGLVAVILATGAANKFNNDEPVQEDKLSTTVTTVHTTKSELPNTLGREPSIDNKFNTQLSDVEINDINEYMSSSQEIASVVGRALYELNVQGMSYGSKEKEATQNQLAREIIATPQPAATEVNESICSNRPSVNVIKDNRLGRGRIELDMIWQDCDKDNGVSLSRDEVRLRLVLVDKEERQSFNVPLIDSLNKIAINSADEFNVSSISASKNNGEDISINLSEDGFYVTSNGNDRPINNMQDIRSSVDEVTRLAGDISKEM